MGCGAAPTPGRAIEIGQLMIPRPYEQDGFETVNTVTVRRVNYGAWLLKLFGWDGLLPVVVLLGPVLVGYLFPDNREAVDMTGVFLPVGAVFVRFFIGKREIDI